MKKLFIASLLFISATCYAASPESDIVEFPKLSSPIEIVYPSKAEREQLEGTVILKIQVLTNGTTGEVAIFKSSSFPILDAAAVKSATEARFSPARNRLGLPINSTVFLPVEFKLLP